MKKDGDVPQGRTPQGVRGLKLSHTRGTIGGRTPQGVCGLKQRQTAQMCNTHESPHAGATREPLSVKREV